MFQRKMEKGSNIPYVEKFMHQYYASNILLTTSNALVAYL
jgi:hypothetical protein